MTTGAESSSALNHIRVLDLSGPTGQFCARVMGDMGADVILVEPPGGTPTRAMPPFAHDEPGPDRSLVHLDRNRSKRGIVLDLLDPANRETARALAAGVDIVVEDFQPGYLSSIGLGYEDIAALNPGVVYVSITPFGQTGPHAHYRGADIVAQARGGILFANGDDTQRPAMVPDDVESLISCLHGTFGALAALRHRRVNGRGQHVDVSRQEIVLYTQGNYIPRYSLNGTVTRREGRLGGMAAGVNLFQARDGGYVSLAPFMRHHFQRLARDVVKHPVMSDPSWADPVFRGVAENRRTINAYIEEFAATIDRDAFVEAGQGAGVPAVPVLRVDEAVNHPHSRERGFFQEHHHPTVGSYVAPGPPVRMGESPWRVSRPAPALGQHTDEILKEARERPVAAPVAGAGTGAGGDGTALAGLRVADFSRAFAGPLATMLLGFFGAQVVKLESEELEDNRTGGQATFQELNRAKISATIDTRLQDGKDLIKRLVGESDVVLENFRPNVMDRLGLNYEALREARPDLIMVSMPGFGRSGPLKDYFAYGQQIMGTTGLLQLWGHPESPLPVRVKYAFPDYVAGVTAGMTVLAALEFRDETGRGQFIELAQFEALAHLLGTAFIDYTMNGRVGASRGNTSAVAAPHDLYPCRGEDLWIAIAVEGQDQWAALVNLMGSPAWVAESAFATPEARIANKADLDRHVGRWTATLDQMEAETLLQAAGVPAGVVADVEQIVNDPHLAARGMVVDVPHGENRAIIRHAGVNVHLSATPGNAAQPAPQKGGGNDVVFNDILRLTPEERRALDEAGALK